MWVRHDADLSDGAHVFAICNASGAAGCNSAGDNTNVKTVASTITPSGGTVYRYRIRQAQSGVGGLKTIYMRVNDETEKTFCSSGCDDTLGTLSTAANWSPFIMYLTRTTSGSLSGDLDYFSVSVTFPSARY